MTVKSPFARLFRSAAAKASDDDDAAKRKAKRMADQEDGDEIEDEDSKEDKVVDKVVDDAEDDLKNNVDDVEDDPDAKRKAKKKAKAKDGDDDSDDEDEKDPKARAARTRERGRVAAIMASPEAQANPTAALFVALRTSASRDTAVADIKAMGPAAATGKDRAIARLAGVDVPDVGNGDSRERSNTRATADAIIRAGKMARGEV